MTDVKGGLTNRSGARKLAVLVEGLAELVDVGVSTHENADWMLAIDTG